MKKNINGQTDTYSSHRYNIGEQPKKFTAVNYKKKHVKKFNDDFDDIGQMRDIYRRSTAKHAVKAQLQNADVML